MVAILEDVIRGERLASLPMTLEAAMRDRLFPPNAAALNHTPACRRECGIDMFGSRLGFIHMQYYSWPVKAWCSSDFFNASSAPSFCSYMDSRRCVSSESSSSFSATIRCWPVDL